MHRTRRRRGEHGRAGIWLAMGAVLLLAAGNLAAQEDEGPQAYIVRLEGMITEADFIAVRDRIERAKGAGVETFVLELNTPGGTVAASESLANYIFQQDDIQVIAYVHNRALSGGTMVALACKAIYIDSRIGQMGDVAPIGPSGEILNEKQQTVIRETMANFSRARGYPEALVKAMVTKEIEVFRIQTLEDPEGAYAYVTGETLRTMSAEERKAIISEELIVPAGQLLTMSGQRAVEYGFAAAAVDSPQQLYDELGLDPPRVQRLYFSTSERLLNILDALSPLLIVGGAVLLFLELMHPGFGLPGALGVGCFVLLFLVKVSLNYAHLLEVLLFAAGLALLLVEIFIIPGFGITGLSGLALMFVGLVLAFQEFTIPHSQSEMEAFQRNIVVVLGSLVGSAVAIGIVMRLSPSLPGLRRVIQTYDLGSAHVGEMQEARTPGLSQMQGEVGMALTPLRPAGRAQFGDNLLDVVAEGEFVDRGETIRIVEVHGNRVVVEPYREV